MVEKAIKWWEKELEGDAWKQDNYRFKGIQWWFQYKLDECVKVMKQQEEANPQYKIWKGDGG